MLDCNTHDAGVYTCYIRNKGARTRINCNASNISDTSRHHSANNITSSDISRYHLPVCKSLFRLSMRLCTAAILVLTLLHLITPVHSCYEFPPGKQDPCEGAVCHVGAECVSNSDGSEARCQCRMECNNYGDSIDSTPVCGNDGMDYKSLCELRRASCTAMKEIKVAYYGRCDPCAGIQCERQQVCRLRDKREPVCECEAYCDTTLSPVCGSDGNTYSNECFLRQKACQSKRDIFQRHPGDCRDESPCASLRCGPNRDCSIDRMGQAACVCPLICPPLREPVCGSDHITYHNTCELRRQACKANTLTSVAHLGACESLGACQDVECKFDAVCVVERGEPQCQCPNCPALYDPVCANNGIGFTNECLMKRENCIERKHVRMEHRGLCSETGCENNTTVCQYYSHCEVSGGLSQCVCPSNCDKTEATVCGTDGITYVNECQLRLAACKKQLHIYITYYGMCADCNGIQCKFGARCDNGHCVCPVVCPNLDQQVCATGQRTYRNTCEMRKEACRLSHELEVIHSGDCSDMLGGSGEGSGGGELDDCDETSCQFGGACLLLADGSYTCHCSFSCDAIRDPVCGSDGKSYGNQCELQAAACEQQRGIVVQSRENCDDLYEVLCDGRSPIEDQSTMRLYTCTGGHDCPAGTYCHLQFNKCCAEDNCHCNAMGSYSTTCRAGSRQCECKPGVGGAQCDRCLPGYWGLHLVQAHNQNGCRPCNCHPVGAQRTDCHQMTGRCICNEGYDGLKCGRCVNIQMPAGPHGCTPEYYSGATVPPFTTRSRSRKTTRHIQPSNYMTDATSKKSAVTRKPPNKDESSGNYGRIGDLCLEDSYCLIPNSYCRFTLCYCNEGYIPTMQNTQCSEVKMGETETIHENFTACTLNPCLHQGVCQLDTSLGYRCLCGLGWSGTICKHRTTFTSPSFSGTSYLVVNFLRNISGDFYMHVTFHSMNRDGILLFTSEFNDGTGRYLSLVINNGHIEFRYDLGRGPVQMRHPYPVAQDGYHEAIVKRLGDSVMLIVDNMEPMASTSLSTEIHVALSGRLYLGYLARNISNIVEERVGMNLGFVGCIQGLTAGHLHLATIYNLHYPSPDSQILDGQDIAPCEDNPCQSLPCLHGGTCVMLDASLFQCICQKGHTGPVCEGPDDQCTSSLCHPSATCTMSGKEVICHCPGGREGQYCEFEKLEEVSVPEFVGDSYMVIPIPDSMAKQMSIEVWFLTHKPNGMLLVASQFIGGLGDFISLNIVELYVEFRFNLGDGPVVIRSSEPIELDKWHRAVIGRTDKDAELIINERQPDTASSPGHLIELQLAGSVQMGGYQARHNIPPDSNIQANLSGAIQRMYINGRLLEEPLSVALETYHIVKFDGPPCNLNPCLNGGVCVPHLDKASCRCPQRYIGEICEKVAENLETKLPVRFNGKMFLQYLNEITSRQQAQRRNEFRFQLRTHQKAGVLLFQGRGQGVTTDYLTIVLTNGSVEMSYNLGKQSAQSLFRIRSSVHVSDGDWHTVFAERNKREAHLQVDDEPVVVMSSAVGTTQLDTDGMIWIGGKQDLPWGLPDDYYRGYKGCLGEIYINNVQLDIFDHRNGHSNTIEFCH